MTGEEIVIRAGFEVSEEDQRSIRELLENIIGEALRVRFERSADSICGIELKLHGHKIGWSIDSYLDSLEKSIANSLGEPAQPSGRI